MISYWREHRRRRWCLHLRNRALAHLVAGDIPASHVALPVAHATPLPTSDFAVATQFRFAVTSTSGLKLALALTDLVTLVGSGPECRWRFLNAGLDRRHYAFIVMGNAVFGINLHGTRRRPEAVFGEWWQPRTVVNLGRLSLRLQSTTSTRPGKRDDSASMPPLQLHWNAAGNRHAQPLHSRLTVLGSSPWSTIRLHHPGVAPVQAALLRLPRSIVLVDFVDNTWTRRHGQPVAWSLLDPGDEFEIGRTTFQLAADWDEPSAPAAAPVFAQHTV